MEIVTSRMKRVPSWKDPRPMDRARAFYEPTSAAFIPGWQCAGMEAKLDGKYVPTMSEALAGKVLIHKPVKLNVDMSRYPITAATRKAKEDRLTEMGTAPIQPSTFPAVAKDFRYPASGKRGANNPLYSTAAMVIGLEPPQQHQLAERYFPKNCDFVKTFTHLPHTSGLITKTSFSNVHKELDQPY